MLEQTTYDPEYCDREVFERGECVAMLAIPKADAEALCAMLRRETGARVDWSYMSGRNVVRAIGNVEAVRATLAGRGYSTWRAR